MSTAVAKKEAASVVNSELADLYRAQAGEGLSDIRREDFALPFLLILQALSPEVQRGDPKEIKGAVPGDLVNSLTKERFEGDRGVRIVRVAVEVKYIEWRPRDAGGGLVKISDSKDEADHHRTAFVDPTKGYQDKIDTAIVETHQIYCLVETPTGWRPVVLPWTKTKLKEARRWNGLLADQISTKFGIPGAPFVLPTFGVIYQLTTRAEKNKANQTYFVPVVEPTELSGRDILGSAGDFRKTVSKGEAKVKYEEVEMEIVAEPSNPEAAGKIA